MLKKKLKNHCFCIFYLEFLLENFLVKKELGLKNSKIITSFMKVSNYIRRHNL